MVYDPKIGRFLTRDPSGVAGGVNEYEAFKDDPVNWDDPTGLAPEPADPFAQYSGQQHRALQVGFVIHDLQNNISNLQKWIADHEHYLANNPPSKFTTGTRNDRIQRLAVNQQQLQAAQGDLAAATATFHNEGLDNVKIDGEYIWGDTVNPIHTTGMKGIAEAARDIAYQRAFGLQSTGDEMFLIPTGTLFKMMAGAGEKVAAATAVKSASAGIRSLPIIGETFVPDTKAVLQNLATQQSERLAKDPSLAQSVLSPAEYRAGQNSVAVARMQYGNAVERLARDEIKSDSNLSVMYQHWGGPGQPDFATIGLWQGKVFDMSTASGALNKGNRWYGQMIDDIIYQRPAGFTVFP